MSAREIIAQIETLPDEEKAQVIEYVHKIEAEAQSAMGNEGVNPALAKSAEQIFQKYDNLFRKLAK